MALYRLLSGSFGRFETDGLRIYQAESVNDIIELNEEDAERMASRVRRVADDAERFAAPAPLLVEPGLSPEPGPEPLTTTTTADGQLATAPPPESEPDPGDVVAGTVDQVRAAVAEIEDVDLLREVLRIEKKGKNRNGVANVISERIAELKGRS